MAWFARVLVPELGQSGSLDQVAGGWTVGANRIAAVEDRLTILEASAPDEATRTGRAACEMLYEPHVDAWRNFSNLGIQRPSPQP